MNIYDMCPCMCVYVCVCVCMYLNLCINIYLSIYVRVCVFENLGKLKILHFYSPLITSI